MARGGTLNIAVLGAGPVGLEAALQLLRAGHTVHLYERGEVAEHLGRWGHVRMFSPFAWNSSSVGLETITRDHPRHDHPAATECITGHEFRDRYLLPLSRTAPLATALRLKTEVIQIGRTGLIRTDPSTDPRRTTALFRLLVRDEKGVERIEEHQAIVDCTGTYATPNWLGDGGIPAPGERAAAKQLVYGLEDVLGSRKTHYAGRSVLVLGGGYSAATNVCQLATLAEEHPATWVFWLARGPKSTPLPRIPGDPLKERDRLAARANSLASRGDGNVEFHGGCTIQSIESLGGDKGFAVNARCHGKPANWVVDRVIVNVGHRPDRTLAEALHVELPDGSPTSVRQPEPGYFVLGAKSHGRGAGFLLKQGQEQIKELLNLLAVKSR